MGLDHGIKRRHYVKNWDFMKPEEKHKITILKGGKPANIDTETITDVTTEVITLRKANAIHAWFVSNVQEGEDDCKDYYVSAGQLKDLLDTINKVLAASKLKKGKVANGYTFNDKQEKVFTYEDGRFIEDPTMAAELLPTENGFFFGSTDYDEYYYNDLVITKEAIEKTLKVEDGDFFYWSSW